jgi:hypothetical protein
MTEIVYKVPGRNAGPKGKTYDWIAVKSEAEFEQKLKEEWFNTLDEAVNGKAKELVRARNEEGEFVGDDPSTPDVNEAYTDAPPTRDEIKAKAKELNIVFAKNITDKKLLELIEAALAKD